MEQDIHNFFSDLEPLLYIFLFCIFVPVWTYWNSEKKYAMFYWGFMFGNIVLVLLACYVHELFFIFLVIFIIKMNMYYYREIKGTEDDFCWRIMPRKRK